MNRRRLLAVFLPYLVFWFLLFLTLDLIATFFHLSPLTTGVFLLLFGVTAMLFLRRIAEMEQGVRFLKEGLEDIGKGVWDKPMMSSDIEELWSAQFTFYTLRQTLHDKIAKLEGEKKLTQILSNLKEGIVVADPANQIIFANAEAAGLLGIPMSDLVGKSLDAFLDRPFRPIFEALIAGDEKSETLSIDNSAHTLLFRSFLLKSPEEGLIEKIVMLYDITESKKVEEMRKAFVANASHELRSPAASLQALLDALTAAGSDHPDERVKFMLMMEREINRLNLIIHDLLDLSELEREKEFQKEPVKIVKLFSEWLESYEVQKRQRGIEIVSQFENPDLKIEGSPPDIEKLFRNLIDNAMKYTPSGGTIELGLKPENASVRGWVKDTGPGIPPEHLNRIFERFYRVDKSRSRAFGGTGLGLSIAKHAVERHGGKIWAESDGEHGTTFNFLLPLADLSLLGHAQAGQAP